MDTSTFVGTVGVLRDGELLAEWSASVRASHGETLLPHVARVLELAQLSMAEIDALAVGIGPGSFTGVRIGVATAKGLALAQGVPLVGVTSLRVLARGLLGEAGLRVVLVDAYKGEVYAAAYALADSGALEERVAPFHAPPLETAQRLLAAAPEGPLWLAGNGLARYPELLPALGARARRAPPLCDVPRAACLAHEAQLQLLQHGPSDLARLEPLYLRPSDAKLPT
ncbi:MAG TPA: tRNA (adenosine(37)-N6)-threonylcarbamoyltransferase complex dimerization subunit type 1 TsaB [Polyangiales bacterium]